MVASPQLLIDAGAAVGLPGNKLERPLLVHRSHPAMGTLFEACLTGVDEVQLASVAEACLAEVQRLDHRLSRFHSQSETARINREARQNSVIVDYELAELLTLCYTAWQQTEGWFDIAANQAWSIRNGHVEFLELGTQLDFSSVAKGYALDRAAELLEEFSITNALLSAGTRAVIAKGNAPGKEGWQVRVRNPIRDVQGAELTFSLFDQALSVVATSDFQLPTANHAAVAVVAATGFEAEVLSSALINMGRARAIDFLTRQSKLRIHVAWIDEVTYPHEGTWHWLT